MPLISSISRKQTNEKIMHTVTYIENFEAVLRVKSEFSDLVT